MPGYRRLVAGRVYQHYRASRQALARGWKWRAFPVETKRNELLADPAQVPEMDDVISASRQVRAIGAEGHAKKARRDFQIYSDFDLDIEESSDWEWWSGNKRKYIYGVGEVDGGDHKVIIKTTNGDVYIKKSS